MRKFENILYFIFIPLLIVCCGTKNGMTSIEIKKLDYPSASSVEYIDGKLYLMGDDATYLLVLDTSLNIIDSIPLLSYPEKRIPKETKPDIEASAVDGDNLFLFGSGSLSPYRNFAWTLKTLASSGWTVYPPLSALQDSGKINLEPLFLKMKELGIEQINIEGACFVSGKLILVNRGNKSYPYNHLIIEDEKFPEADSMLQISVAEVKTDKDDRSPFKGISGLCYAKESDKLIMTVSTEDTKNSYDDGTIGKSYLWIINSFSTKLNNKSISRNRHIDLEYLDPRFKGHKIESATVIGETNELIHLVMVADNDDGSSTVFKMSIRKTTSLVE